MIMYDKEYLQQLHDSLGLAVFAVKLPERIIEYVNPTIVDVLGYSSKECIGKSTEIIYPSRKDYIKYGKLVSKNIQQNKKIINLEFKLKRKNGEVFLAEIITSFIKKNDKILSAVSIVKDITFQKEVEEKLRQSEKRFRELMEMLPEAVFEADIDANLTYANQQSFKISGYTSEDFDNGLNGIELLVPEDRKRATENLARIFHGEDVGINEYKALRKDGSIFPVLLHTAPILDREGTIKGVRGIIVDISQRKLIEQELIEEKKNLEEVNTALKIILRENELRKTELEEKVFLNIEKLLMPYLSELESSNLNEKQQFLLDAIQKNIKEITGSFSRDLTTKYNNLTPREIQIANLIRQGRTNKEIAKFLSISPSAVDFHRQNLREKLNIKGEKLNLRAILLDSQF